MSLKLVVRKLGIKKEKFITSYELKAYCKELRLDYFTVVGYLTRHNYIIRILKGIFYIKSIEERKLKKIDIDHLAVIKKALEIKDVKNWYFGLETAIKLNNLTHEYFTTDYIINDKIFRFKPINIMGYKTKFIKLNKKLFGFGIKKKIHYSDIEKTVLDIIYLAKYHGLKNEEIKSRIIDLMDYCSKIKIKRYSEYYPKTVRIFVSELL